MGVGQNLLASDLHDGGTGSPDLLWNVSGRQVLSLGSVALQDVLVQLVRLVASLEA